MAEESFFPVPKPGFFHLDLFVKDTKDVSPWYDELKARLDQETGPMEAAMTNLLAVFAFYKLRGRGEARKLLEDLTRMDKDNLNAIANKQFIYGQLMRAKDEMTCRDRLQELLSDQSDAARARNARCLAEQGFALAFDVRDDSKDMVSKIRRAIGLFEDAEDGHREHYIAEIAFWIKEGYKKYTDITPVLRHCVFKFGNQMLQVCRYLIDCDNCHLARTCLECFERHRNDTYRADAASLLSTLPEEDAEASAAGMDDRSPIQPKQETRVKVPVTVEKSRHGQEFEYDFFVSHSSKDAGWVNYVLLPALEVDMRFKGCVADRDFIPGKSVYDNIISSIENSYKTLLVLTPHFMTSEWCKYETEQALYKSLRGKTERVIPIMLEACDVPESLRTITYFDVSRDVIGSYDWLKLKKALEQTPSKGD